MSGIGAKANELDLAQAALDAMLVRAGVPRADSDELILLSYANELERDPKQLHRMAVLFDSALQGFFHLAADGHAFVPTDRFAQELGASLDRCYPGAGASFMRLATTYWTLKMLEGRVALRFSGVVLQQLLCALERRVGDAFFPEDPADDDVEARARIQRDLIEQSGAPIDVDDLLLGNPMLVGNPLSVPPV